MCFKINEMLERFLKFHPQFLVSLWNLKICQSFVELPMLFAQGL